MKINRKLIIIALFAAMQVGCVVAKDPEAKKYVISEMSDYEMSRVTGLAGGDACMACKRVSTQTGSKCTGKTAVNCGPNPIDAAFGGSLACTASTNIRLTNGPSKHDECLPGGTGGCKLPVGWCVEYAKADCTTQMSGVGPICVIGTETTGLHDGDRNVAQSCTP